MSFNFSEVTQYPTAADSTLKAGKRKPLIEEIDTGTFYYQLITSRCLIEVNE